MRWFWVQDCETGSSSCDQGGEGESQDPCVLVFCAFHDGLDPLHLIEEGENRWDGRQEGFQRDEGVLLKEEGGGAFCRRVS